jgi:LDH2 family malate/lactate/ureidoglycolate dehydrogenase
MIVRLWAYSPLLFDAHFGAHIPSRRSAGKIEKYERLGMDTPKGMVIDTEGKERTDTVQVLPGYVSRSRIL